ncbi:hypothetical protein [Nocardioides sp.]|uniref:hypothetical protein n=1 Tax=Nocardioides sp. TaxID=35761 RepID=UPI00352860CB
MRWLWAAVVLPPAGLAALWLGGLDPDPVPVLLLGVAAVLGVGLGAAALGEDRPGWPTRSTALRNHTPDDRFMHYVHLLEDNERSRAGQAALADRLTTLRQTRARLRGVDVTEPARQRGRLTRRQIDDLVRDIEELR